MKTLAVLAIIWTLYSMYRVIRKPPRYEHDFFIMFGAIIGFVALLAFVIYLIITYLP